MRIRPRCRTLAPLLIIAALVILTATVQPSSSEIEPYGAAPVLTRLDPNANPHPDSSLWNFRRLLDAPAGRHGFVTTRPDGHFYFQDGTRARFWGINVASTSVFRPHKSIDQIVDVLARAGINLVRFHDVDDRGGIIDYSRGDSQHFSAAHLQTLDYWIWRCEQAGIYVYLDLLDYRTFKKGDGVPNASLLNRGAKPYAVFDPRLIALQKEYAKRLLVQHVNRYTHLSYANDPGVCMLELYDENGLFIKRTILRKLAWPYESNLTWRWNNWLRDRYHTTHRLAAAWTNREGEHALQRGESLERATVQLPQLLLRAEWNRPYSSALQSPARVNDATIFAYTVQANYCEEMKSFLRKIGVRVPITAVGSQDAIPDLKSISDTLDFTGNNFYWDHPAFPRDGKWRLPSFFHGKNPIESMDGYSFAPTTAFYKVRGKPLVLREWNYCWPNRYRDVGMLEAAAYGCLQDVDAMILFTYDTQPNQRELSYFDVSHDPCRWSEVAPLSEVFLDRLVAPAKRTVDIGYSTADVFHYYGYQSSVYSLAWQSRVENLFFNRKAPVKRGDVVVASGHSAAAAYPGRHAVIRTNDFYHGITLNRTSYAAAARSGYPLRCVRSPASPFRFSGDLYKAGVVDAFPAGLRYPTSDVRARGYFPIGVTPDGYRCLGFYDPTRDNYVFQDLDEESALRVTLDAMRRWFGVPNDSSSVHRDRLVSDTGEITRDSATGVLRVKTPRFEAIAGNLRPHDVSNGPDGLRVHSESDEGTVMALSLDGLPLGVSRRYLVQMTTGARNTGQIAHGPQNGIGRATLVAGGDGPVRTSGEPIDDATRVWLDGRLVASVYLHAGTWIMLRDDDHCTFYCDTPGVKVQIAGFNRPRVIEPSTPGSTPLTIVTAQKGVAFLTPSPNSPVSLEAG
ncbi:MAG TPA: hypothetical protein VFJ58_19075 [Armatimonadota bacterium]|nr:hypothetical protein [Armatimonadota bacterium]